MGERGLALKKGSIGAKKSGLTLSLSQPALVSLTPILTEPVYTKSVGYFFPKEVKKFAMFPPGGTPSMSRSSGSN